MSGYELSPPLEGCVLIPWVVTEMAAKMTGKSPAASNAAGNGPDQGQLLAAAGSWRTDGMQREP